MVFSWAFVLSYYLLRTSIYTIVNKNFKAVDHDYQILMIFTFDFYLTFAWGLVILFRLFTLWFKHSDFHVDTTPLPYYPKQTIVVPAQ